MALSVNYLPVKFEQSMEDAFPDVEPGIDPFGSRILVQIRTAKKMTKAREEGGIELTNETREAIAYNVQVAKVRAIGPVAFRNRTTLEAWPEGDWAKVGDFVRVPKYGGDRWERPIPGSDDMALFVVFNDLELVGKVTVDPRDIVAFI